jgi:hypothetical protein
MAWISKSFGEREYPYNPKCPALLKMHAMVAGKGLECMGEALPEKIIFKNR